MPSRKLFATLFYEGQLDDDALLAELDDACRSVADADTAGQDWSAEHGYGGYTSYASLDDLPRRDPRFGDLVRHLDKHVAAFARDCAFNLGGKRLKLDSLWINLLEPGGAHSGHIDPHSVISGTIYVAVPPGSGPLKLEDPRLPLMMAAPPRRAESGEDHASFVYAAPRAGTIFLWESWLRHEVPASAADDFRISISFNYRW